MTTFLNMYNELADELDFDTVATLQSSITDEMRRLKQQINRASRRIWWELNKDNEEAETEYSLSIVAGTSEYAYPTGMHILQMVRLEADDPPIRIVPWTDFYLHYNPTILTVTGYPGVCTTYKRKIIFHPTPDNAYTATLFGLGTHTDMSADADTPPINSEYHDVVQELALYYAMKYENNPMTAAQKLDAEKAVKTMKKRMRAHNTLAPRLMGEWEYPLGDDWRRSS